jgi:hypothetical protein
LGDGQEVLLRQGRAPEDGAVAAAQPGDRVGIAFRRRAGLLLGGTDGGEAMQTRDSTLEGAVI